MIPAYILIILFTVLFLAVAFLTLRWMADVLVRRAEKRRRMDEPETHGDGGGWPVDAKGYPTMLPKTMGQHAAYEDALDRFFKKRTG